MGNRRAHIVIPDEVVLDIDAIVGKRGRSEFLVMAARNELKRLRMLSALDRAAGAWKRGDHPELRRGAGPWLRKLRQEDRKRFNEVSKR